MFAACIFLGSGDFGQRRWFQGLEVQPDESCIYTLRRGGQFDRAQRTEKALNTVSANLLHRKRSTARYGNPLFSSPAVDLYDKHGNLLIPKPRNTPFSCLSISTLCRGAPGHSPTPHLSPTPAASTTAQTKTRPRSTAQ